MSLLMEALRKAEEAKRKQQQNLQAESGPESLQLEPIQSEALLPPANEVTPSPLSLAEDDAFRNSISYELEALNQPSERKPAQASTGGSPLALEEVASVSATPSLTPATPRPSATKAPSNPAQTSKSAAPNAAQSAVQNAFAAKKSSSNKSFALFIGGLTAVAIAGIGGYFWWQLQPKAGTLAAAPRPLPPAPPLTPNPATNPANVPSPPPAGIALPPGPAANATQKPTPAKPDTTVTVGTLATNPQQQEPEKLFNRSNQRASKETPQSAVRFTASKPAVNPYVAQAYDALQNGKLTLAQKAYERALSTEPYNADALHGLAAIALQQGKPELAEAYYQRALEADPKDAYAIAGMSGLRQQPNAVNTESRLKAMLAEQPEVAALHFSLGNHYARENRWRDAQQAYFQAYRLEPENADIAYNLAVSLDQIHQGKLAAQYYAEALRLAALRPAGFNLAGAQKRLRELQP